MPDPCGHCCCRPYVNNLLRFPPPHRSKPSTHPLHVGGKDAPSFHRLSLHHVNSWKEQGASAPKVLSVMHCILQPSTQDSTARTPESHILCRLSHINCSTSFGQRPTPRDVHLNTAESELPILIVSMADKPVTNSISVLILWLAWACLSLTNCALKNLVLDTVFPSKEVMEVIVHRASFEFAPGLLDVLRSRTAPTISYFKTLPQQFSQRWAVYLLVLGKADCRPRTYIGSGTKADGGVSRRMTTYDKASREILLGRSVCNVPLYVDKALREGFKITHKGLLAWTSIPSVNEQYALRGLFLILDCAFSLYF
jgi:hypothetical protein